MATDMANLARNVGEEAPCRALKLALLRAAEEAEGCGILARLAVFGRAVSASVAELDETAFSWVASHASDVVRQWGVYAVNDATRTLALYERLNLTLRFAADHHMSVRECAWMAFRPHLAASLPQALALLEPASRAADPNVRRFAIEVTRPRSVWGVHIAPLKQHPAMAMALLENVYQDSSRYVRLSAGNWLNDASKTRPDWVRKVCSRWSKNANKHTEAIIRRGLRTLVQQRRYHKSMAPLLREAAGVDRSKGSEGEKAC